METCRDEDECLTPMWCRGKDKCQKQVECDKANGPLDAAAGSPIPAIESSVLNIGTAVNDCEWAKSKWIDGEWNDCVMWINNAIAQLESARSKIQAHQQEENNQEHPTGGV